VKIGTALEDSRSVIHNEGDGELELIFVTSPSPVNPGLGPAFNDNSCQSCRADNGRGKPDDTLTSLILGVSVTGETGACGSNPETGFDPASGNDQDGKLESSI
jgi:CxxC motif-containing protein (DUF1111 family)